MLRKVICNHSDMLSEQTAYRSLKGFFGQWPIAVSFCLTRQLFTVLRFMEM